jgi:hypothetical protein
MTKFLDDEKLFFEIDGKEYCDEEQIIVRLLKDGILFCNTRKYLCLDGEERPETIVLFMNCNDIFVWGGDAETITENELPVLYELHLADPKWGSVKWICQKRNERPLASIVRDMKREGAWDKIMKRLPKK